MNQSEKFVPIVPAPIEQVQQVQNGSIGTSTGTAIGTTSLKALALKQLQKQKQVQSQVQPQVQSLSPCTYPDLATGTASSPDSGEPTPTPEQIAHAQRMLVDCPSTGGKLHCWHCSRCGDARRCMAWRSRRADVEFFRRSERPYSLYLVEEMAAPEVLQ